LSGLHNVSDLRSADYVGHILNAIVLVQDYTQGLTQKAFAQDKRTQQAVLLNIMIIGEAATKLAQSDPGLLARHPQVPWSSMRGMRNRVAHGYFDIDLQVVWDTTQTALPELATQLHAVLTDLTSNPLR
jgi:uncharacterized protein with HEPN domain